MPSNKIMIPFLKASDFKLFGKIEKIFATYGFVVTADGQRYFFHFGTCVTKPEFFRVGDDVEFVLGEDIKTHRLHAQKMYKLPNPPTLVSASRATPIFSYIPIPLDTSSSVGSSTGSLTLSSQQAPQPSPPSLSPPAMQGCLNCLNNQHHNHVPQQHQQRQSLLITSNIGQESVTRALLQLQQHSSASIQCDGLVMSLPDVQAFNFGCIACEIAGNPTFVRYQYAGLKFPQDKPLIRFGAKVNMTAVWNSEATFWSAKDIIPESPELPQLSAVSSTAYDKAREAWFSV